MQQFHSFRGNKVHSSVKTEKSRTVRRKQFKKHCDFPVVRKQRRERTVEGGGFTHTIKSELSDDQCEQQLTHIYCPKISRKGGLATSFPQLHKSLIQIRKEDKNL